MARLKKVYTETVTSNFITEDGELKNTTRDVKHHNILIDNKDTFSMTFGAVIGALEGLSSTEIRILIWCSLNCILNTNEIEISKNSRKHICKAMDISDATCKNYLSSLVNKRVLFRNHKALYTVNPKYFWRGDMQERNKSLKYILELELVADKNIVKSKAIRNDTSFFDEVKQKRQDAKNKKITP